MLHDLLVCVITMRKLQETEGQKAEHHIDKSKNTMYVEYWCVFFVYLVHMLLCQTSIVLLVGSWQVKRPLGIASARIAGPC
jgi:hypothetical protein